MTQTSFKKLIVPGVVLLGIVVLGTTSSLTPLRNFFTSTVVAVNSPLDDLESLSTGAPSLLLTKGDLRSEVKTLRTENEKLRLLLLRYQEQQEAFSELLDLHRVASSTRGTAEEMRIVRRYDASPYNTMLISNDGSLSKGDVISVYGEVAIGTVERVDRETAIVELLWASDKGITAQVGSHTVLVKGGGRGMYVAELPEDTQATKGDVVTYDDYILGSVAYIETDADTSTKNAYIASPVNILSHEFVTVYK